MATRNIVPRASGEGQLGTSSKLWNQTHQLTSSFGTATLKEDSNNKLTLSGSPFVASSGLSGSLTQLANGSSYLVEGSGVTITSGSTGQVTISASGGGSGATDKIEEGNTLVETIDSGTNGHIVLQTEGTERWHVTSGGHIIPQSNAAYDLGNAEYKVRHLFLSDNSMKFGPGNDSTISAEFGVNDSGNIPKWTKSSTAYNMPIYQGTPNNNQVLKYSTSLGEFKPINDTSITNVIVTVNGSNKYVIDGTAQQSLSLAKGVTYYFDQSDSSNSNHPLKFSATSGGTEYTVGITYGGTPGSAGAYTQVTLEQDAPSTLYYYCSVHGFGMGSIAYIGTSAAAGTLAGMQSGAPGALALLTQTELEILDGATLSTTELNYVDGVTSAIQTQLDAKSPLSSPTFTGTVNAANLTLSGDLTVNGTTTTIDTQNLLVEDPMVLLASGASSANQNGGLAILSGSSVSSESLVIWRVDNDIWGVGRMDVQSGAVTDLSTMTSVSFKAADLISTTGVISGSSNKAIEFDSLGNITTLTTGSVSTNDFLKYDGTKWVCATTDAMTVTYAPEPVYARISVGSNYTLSVDGSNNAYAQYDTEDADTSPNSDIVDLTNNQLVVPAGVTKVRIVSNFTATDSDIVIVRGYHIRGGSVIDNIFSDSSENDVHDNFNWISSVSKIVDVQQGDIFKLNVNSPNGTAVYVSSTHLEMQVIEGSILNKTVATTLPNAMSITYAPNPVYARMTQTASQTLSGVDVRIQYNNLDIDTSPNSNLVDISNNRFTIPAGVTKVKILASLGMQSSDAVNMLNIKMFDSGGTELVAPTLEYATNHESGTYEFLILQSSIISVQQGYYLEIFGHATGTTYANNVRTFAEMQVVEGSILNTTVASTITDFSTNKLTLSEGVISGSSNKAIEFDSLGNITTLTTGSVSTNDFLKYDGTKWVGATTDAMTVTYQPDPVYAIMSLSANTSVGNGVVVPFNTKQIDTSSDSSLVDTGNNRFLVP